MLTLPPLFCIFLQVAEAGCAACGGFILDKTICLMPVQQFNKSCPAGKDHVCRFVGCGQNERFTYVVMELQVGFICSPQMFCLLLR